MGLRPKPHKFFEKNLIKNLMGEDICQGENETEVSFCPRHPHEGEVRGFTPKTPTKGLCPFDPHQLFEKSWSKNLMGSKNN